MDVLLNFRFGRISLCYTKGVWLFYFRAYTYNILGSIRKTGTVQWLEQFFFLCLGCKKKTVPNLKNGRNHRNYQKTAIFVKNLKCNIFQVFRRFFFSTRGKKSSTIVLMRGRKDNYLYSPKNENHILPYLPKI